MAKKKNKDIFRDPRYLDFVERYHSDPLRFAVEVCGFEPSDDQMDLFRSIEPIDAWVSVVSGTGTGKTASFAVIAIWHLLCFPFADYDGKLEIGSNTYIGAPKISQVGDGVWKEMEDRRMAMFSGGQSWINDYWKIDKTKVSVIGYEKQWFITQIAMQKGQAVGVAGKHRYYQLIIIDEAAGVPDEHFNVIKGTQTQAGNRILMASQGVRNAGAFYESHHSLSQSNGGRWVSLRMSSENSPFVTTGWIKDRELECGGRGSVEYKIRVRGLFAEDTSNVLLSRSEVETIFTRGRIIADDEPYGLMVLSDVALGEMRDDSVIVIARVVGYEDFGADARRVEFIEIPVCSNTKNEINLAGDVVDIMKRLEDATLMLDIGGVGRTVGKLIQQSGVSFEGVDWGKPCWKKEYKQRFANQRACAMVRFRDAVRQGRVSVLEVKDNRIKQKIINQGSRLPYYFREEGGLKYAMVKKDEMRKEGIKSPDLIDAMSFAFLEQATYTVRRIHNDEKAGAVSQVLDSADQMFNGI